MSPAEAILNLIAAERKMHALDVNGRFTEATTAQIDVAQAEMTAASEAVNRIFLTASLKETA